MKCPQLSELEATIARNQNSIGDRMEKKTLGETRLSRGTSSPLARRTSSLFQLQQSQIVGAPLVPVVFPDGCLGDEVLTGDLVLSNGCEYLCTFILFFYMQFQRFQTNFFHVVIMGYCL